MYTHVIADLTKEFHCMRCGIIQPFRVAWVDMIFELKGEEPNKNGLHFATVCDPCMAELHFKPSPPRPPSEPSPQT